MLEVRLNQTKTDQDSMHAYDRVYDDVGLTQLESFYLWLLELLALQPNEKYLDISCGRGELLSYAAKQKIAPPYGLDLSESALRFCQQHAQLQNLVTANSQQLPYRDNSFDVISNIGSLEHYVDMPAAVRETARVLTPDGRAYVLVPNTFSLLNNIWIAFRQGYTSYDPYQPIQRYAARVEWHELLEENGLIVEKTIGYERPRPRTWNDLRYKYMANPRELVRWLVSPLVPLNLAFCFVFVCRKR